MSKVQTAEIIIAAHNRTQRGIAEAQNGLTALTKNAKDMFAAFASGYAVTQVFGLLKDGVQELADAADQAANLGMMGSQLLLLSRAAKEGGAGMGEVVQVLRKIDENSAAALSGNDAMAESFRRLGVSATVIRGLAPERALEMLAKAYRTAGSDAEAFDALLNITGAKTAPKLLDMLNKLGTEGLDGLAGKFGTVSEEAVLAADRLSDAWGNVLDDIKLSLAGLVLEAVDFWAGVDPGDANGAAQGRAAQNDINRRLKAQNDAARAEMEATKARRDAEDTAFFNAALKYEQEKAAYDAQMAALDQWGRLAEQEANGKAALLEAEAQAPQSRSLQTMSGADLGAYVEQQSFQRAEEKTRREHERKVEAIQEQLVKIQKEMLEIAKKNNLFADAE